VILALLHGVFHGLNIELAWNKGESLHSLNWTIPWTTTYEKRCNKRLKGL